MREGAVFIDSGCRSSAPNPAYLVEVRPRPQASEFHPDRACAGGEWFPPRRFPSLNDWLTIWWLGL